MSTAADQRRVRGDRVTRIVLSVVTALLVVVMVVVVALDLRRGSVASAAGIGDPYYPSAGGSGYDVSAYDLDITFDPAARTLQGTAKVVLTPTANLTTLHLDLALTATSVRLGGNEVPFTQRDGDLAVTPPVPLFGTGFTAGKQVELLVSYGGKPGDAKLADEGAVYATGNETLIAGEPESASAWYPANQHPSDPATFAVTIHVPGSFEAISVGRLVSHDQEGWGEVWRWQTDEPTPTYATMLAVGQFRIIKEDVTVAGRGVQAVYAASEALPDPDRALQWLRRSAQAAETLTTWLGPYPLSSIGGVVPAMKPWWGGLETLGRPIYHPNLVGRDTLLHHELAHMWLGDTVTLQRWSDIFINESLTTYAEWLAEEAAKRGSPQARFDNLYDTSKPSFWTQKLSDPGPGSTLFTRVYDRGAMAVHATRVVMGDEAFFAFFKAWAQQQGPHSLQQWREMAQQSSPADLRPLFSVWLDGTTQVPREPQYGFR